MSKFVKKSGKRIGESPGTLVHIGEKYLDKALLSYIEYDSDSYNMKNVEKLEDCFEKEENKMVKWINVSGLHDINIVERIGKKFGLHPLLIEDILNTNQRAKIEDYDDYILIVLKMLCYDKENNEIKPEQFSFILSSNYVVSFQELESNVFSNVLQRITAGKGNIRKFGPDYLFYALLDAVVDSYFVVLESIGDNSDEIEEKLMLEPGKEVLQMIYKLKREMLFLRNSIWPLRDVINKLLREEVTYFSETTTLYLRDVYDHIVQIIDTVETYRDMSSGMLDTYLSSISNRMNEVMKVLTIFSTIFIPITFIAGIYGMNFKYMPELDLRWGYLIFWIIITTIIVIMLNFFKRKKWF